MKSVKEVSCELGSKDKQKPARQRKVWRKFIYQGQALVTFEGWSGEWRRQGGGPGDAGLCGCLRSSCGHVNSHEEGVLCLWKVALDLETGVGSPKRWHLNQHRK